MSWMNDDGVRVLVDPYSLEIEEPADALAWMRDKEFHLAGDRYLVSFGIKEVPRSRPLVETTLFALYGSEYPCSCYDGYPDLDPPCDPVDGIAYVLTAIDGFGEAKTGGVANCEAPPFLIRDGEYGYLEEYGLITVIFARWISVTESGEPYEDWIRVERSSIHEVDMAPLCATPAWLGPAIIAYFDDTDGVGNLVSDLVSDYGVAFRALFLDREVSTWGEWGAGSEVVNIWTKRVMRLEDVDGVIKHQYVQWEVPEGEWDEDVTEETIDQCGIGGGIVCCPAPQGPPGPQGDPGPQGEPGEPGASSSLGDLIDEVRLLREALVGEGLDPTLGAGLLEIVAGVEALADVEVRAEWIKDGMAVTTSGEREES